MTGRRKGRLAIVALVIVALALGAAIATRPRFRALWLARRLASRDKKARTEARLALLALGRPAVDPWLAEIIAGDLRDRAAPGSDFFSGRYVVSMSARRINEVPLELDRDVTGRHVLIETGEVPDARQVVLGERAEVCEALEKIAPSTRRVVAREPKMNSTVSDPVAPEFELAVLELLRAGVH